MEAIMNAIDSRRLLWTIALAGAASVAISCSQMPTMGASASSGTSQQVTLSGAHEVPPITTTGTATGTVDVKPDRTVTANITVTGITPTAAHIHEGKEG